VNASPLIFLTRVGLLEVLQEPGVPVLVPDIVMAEISSLGPTDPAAVAVKNSSWIQVVPTPAIPVAILPWGLDDGEAGVIAVALEDRDSMAVLDDLAARQCAQALNIQTQGTLGLLLVGKQLGLITAVRPHLEHLRQTGMYLTDRLMNQVLVAAGE
jgi:predicted nucleic acid-binding protein